jgi:hypothetical protein
MDSLNGYGIEFHDASASLHCFSEFIYGFAPVKLSITQRDSWWQKSIFAGYRYFLRLSIHNYNVCAVVLRPV